MILLSQCVTPSRSNFTACSVGKRTLLCSQVRDCGCYVLISFLYLKKHTNVLCGVFLRGLLIHLSFIVDEMLYYCFSTCLPVISLDQASRHIVSG